MATIEEKNARSHTGRNIIVGVAAVCVVVLGYSELGVFRDFRVVNQALPSIPSQSSTLMDMSIAFSPVFLAFDSARRGLTHVSKYPPATEPNMQAPKSDPISDQIQRARVEEGLYHPGDTMPVNGIADLKRPSLEAVGRAIYLSQEKPAAAREFAQNNAGAAANESFDQESRVEQVRQIFQMAYGQAALQEATQRMK